LPRIYGCDLSLTCSGLSDGTTHILVKTKPGDSKSPLGDTGRRISEIISAIDAFANAERDRDFILYVEAPMLNATHANHLYEVGMLNISLCYTFSNARLRWITPATLKKFITGKGNAPKNHDAIKCVKKPCVTCGAWTLHQMKFEGDPGKDKLHSWGLAKMGQLIEAGELEYTPIARRGKGGKKKCKQTTAK
jgi:hypothetical protein